MSVGSASRRARWLRWAPLLLVGVALAVRLLWVLRVAPHTEFGDQEEYFEGARRLLRGEPLAVRNWMLFIRAPGYSLFLAAVWKACGHESVRAVRVVQAILSAATVAYIGAMARLVTRQAVATIVTLAIAAFYPYLVFYCSSPGTETVFAFFVAAGTYHLAHGLEQEAPRLRHLVLAAVLLAAGNLVRPNLSTLLPAIFLWLAWRWRRTPRRLVTVVAAVVVPLLVVTLPWTLAVHRRGEGWMWVTDGAGVWYFMGHNDESLALYCRDLTHDERRALLSFPGQELFMRRPEFLHAAAEPPQRAQADFWRAALAWDRAHLSSLPCLMAQKTFAFWRPWVDPVGYPRKTVVVSLLASLPVLAGGLYGLVLRARRRPNALAVIVCLNLLSATAVAAAFSTEIRYRVPVVDPLLMPYAGLLAALLVRRAKRALRRDRARPSAGEARGAAG